MSDTGDGNRDDLLEQILAGLRAREVPTFPNPKVVFPDQHESAAQSRSVATARLRRKLPMSTKIAAAALIVAATPGSLLLLDLAGPDPLLAALQDAVLKARTATYTVTITIGNQPPQTTRCMVMGRDLVRAESADGTVVIVDSKQKKMLRLSPAKSKAIIIDGLKVPPDFSLLERLSNLSKYAAKVQPGVANREIDGKTGLGFVVDLDGVKYNVWVDSETNLPLRFESEKKLVLPDEKGVQKEQFVKEVWHDFNFNRNLDASLFRLVAPKGYAVETQRAEGSAVELSEAEKQASLTRSASLILSPHDGIGPARFGMSADRIVEALGKPDKRKRSEQDGVTSFHYPKLGLYLSIDTKGAAGLYWIECVSTEFPVLRNPLVGFAGKTDKGVSLGSSLDDLKTAYGPSDHSRTDSSVDGGGLDVHYYQKLDLRFGLSGNKVVRIQATHNIPERLFAR